MRNPVVLVQIESIERVFERTGVTDFCIECIHSSDARKGGCCHGCVNLGPNGCMDKPLACALYLCHEAQQEFPKVELYLRDIKHSFDSGVTYGFRLASIENEKLMSNPERFVL